MTQPLLARSRPDLVDLVDRLEREYRHLDHDPTDFFRRGQVYASFEPDDPAPAYLREALGEMGEELACFSGDYGHWDGVLRDCVKKVAETREYSPAHLGKLLGGNCLRLYGPRLARALAARSRDVGQGAGVSGRSEPLPS